MLAHRHDSVARLSDRTCGHAFLSRVAYEPSRLIRSMILFTWDQTGYFVSQWVKALGLSLTGCKPFLARPARVRLAASLARFEPLVRRTLFIMVAEKGALVPSHPRPRDPGSSKHRSARATASCPPASPPTAHASASSICRRLRPARSTTRPAKPTSCLSARWCSGCALDKTCSITRLTKSRRCNVVRRNQRCPSARIFHRA